MAIGEANGKSTIYYQITIGYPDRLCGPPVVKCCPWYKMKMEEIS